MPDTRDPLVDEIAEHGPLSLAALARRLSVSPSCCFRWATKGIPGDDGGRVKLETLRRGKALLTSEGAYRRFLARHPRSDAPATPQAPPPRSPAERRRGHDDAMARLKARGIA